MKKTVDYYVNSFIEKSNLKIENETIKVPEGSKYLSDFLDDLPYDCFFNKVITGCGGTTLALTNKENYVVAVHSLNVVKNKSEQHSNVLGVHGEMSNDAIFKYLFNYRDKPKKFIVTYDSLPRLIDVIESYGSFISDFRLLVDEVQVLIRNLGQFKMTVSNNLLNNTYKFKSVCYLTATPTNPKYLPEPIKKLKYIELEWSNLEKPNIMHCHLKNQFQTKVFTHVMDLYDRTDDDIYVFYNSKSGVSDVINKIMLINPHIKNEIEIVFADNDSNRKYFKNILSKVGFKNIKLGYQISVDSEGNPIEIERKRIKFISSFGFEGVDFYSFGRDVSTIIAADAKSKSMRYDISIDIPQILGRVRRDKTTGKFPKNTIYLIWKTMSEELNVSNDIDIFKSIAGKIIFTLNVLYDAKSYLDNDLSKSMRDSIFKISEPYIIPNDDGIYVENEYVMEGIMSTYSALHADYHVLFNEDNDNILLDDSIIISNLKNITKSQFTFDITNLNPIYCKNLDRRVSFSNAAESYYNLHEESMHNKDQEIYDEMDLLRKSHDLLDEALEYVSIQYIKSTGYVSTTVKKKIDYLSKIDTIKSSIHKYGIQAGGTYSMGELMETSCKIVNDYKLSCQPKISIIANFFNLKRRIRKNENFDGYFLEEKK